MEPLLVQSLSIAGGVLTIIGVFVSVVWWLSTKLTTITLNQANFKTLVFQKFDSTTTKLTELSETVRDTAENITNTVVEHAKHCDTERTEFKTEFKSMFRRIKTLEEKVFPK